MDDITMVDLNETWSKSQKKQNTAINHVLVKLGSAKATLGRVCSVFQPSAHPSMPSSPARDAIVAGKGSIQS